jgi:acyl-CoA synthetase (AMP-forming)/AMP-acid ligase II
MNEKHRSEERRLHGTWAHLTLDALVETAVRARPGRRSFIDALDIETWSDLTPKTTNAGEFGNLVTRFARQMLSLGLHQGDAVLVAMPNCVDGVASLLGLIAAGLVP